MQANAAPVAKNQYRVKDLPVGEKMLFRVVAVNVAGRSPPAMTTQAVTIREIMGQKVFIIHRNSSEILHNQKWIVVLLVEDVEMRNIY